MRQVSITGYGAAASYKLLPAVAIGGGISAYRFSMNSLFQRFDTDGFFGPSTGVQLEGARATQNGEATAWAPTIGLMIGSADRRFGVVYRQGPSFPIVTESASVGHRDGVFRVPDTLGFGASARLKPPLTVGIEVTRVWYSQLTVDFVTDQARGAERGTGFHIDDGTEIHGGVQYAVPRWRGNPRFRAGAWFDPDHSVQYNPPGPALSSADRLFDELMSTALSRGSNRVHGTGGIGLTFSPHFEFNAGFDATTTTRIFSSSLIVR